MIISESNKFIFVKPVKSAGTSIEVSLGLGCNGLDFISNIDSADIVKEIENNIFLKRDDYVVLSNNYVLKLEEHATLNAIFDYCQILKKFKKISYDFEDYEKISVVRNPWDRVLSYYNYDIATKAHRINGYDQISFDTYLNVTSFRLSCWQFYSLNDLYKVDTILSFEDLKNSFSNKITKKYNINLIDKKFKVLAKNNEPYWKIYNDKQAEIVYNFCKEEIEFFGYEFGKTQPKNI